MANPEYIKLAEEADRSAEMKKVILCDIDQTIAHEAWRGHIWREGRIDEYYHLIPDDHPVEAMKTLLLALHGCGLYKVVYLTARPEKWRALTMAWLSRHEFPIEELLMRPDDDHTPTAQCKINIANEKFKDRSQIALLIEDRADICAAFRECGIVCLQVHI